MKLLHVEELKIPLNILRDLLRHIKRLLLVIGILSFELNRMLQIMKARACDVFTIFIEAPDNTELFQSVSKALEDTL